MKNIFNIIIGIVVGFLILFILSCIWIYLVPLLESLATLTINILSGIVSILICLAIIGFILLNIYEYIMKFISVKEINKIKNKAEQVYDATAYNYNIYFYKIKELYYIVFKNANTKFYAISEINGSDILSFVNKNNEIKTEIDLVSISKKCKFKNFNVKQKKMIISFKKFNPNYVPLFIIDKYIELTTKKEMENK